MLETIADQLFMFNYQKKIYLIKKSIAVVILGLMVIAYQNFVYAQETTALVGATLVNSDGSKVTENSVILISGDHIVQVGKLGQIAIPASAKHIDLQGKWIIPGLIDAHTHLGGRGSIYDQSNVLDLKKYISPEQAQEAARKNIERTLARYLRAGVTTVVDIGGPVWILDVRETARTMSKAPRVFVAGPIVSIKSANDPIAVKDEDSKRITIASEEDAVRAIRKLAEYRVDIVKLYMMPEERSGVSFSQTFPLYKAAVDEAHKLGMRVGAHALRYDIAQQAIEAGVDVLVHGVMDEPVEDAFLEKLKKNHTIYTTTLIVFDGGPTQVLRQDISLSRAEYAIGDQDAIGSFFDLAHLPVMDFANSFHTAKFNARKRLDVLLPNLKRVQDAGIPIALGTDAGLMGIVHAATVSRELELMAKAGLSTQQIINAATLGGALYIGKEKELGSIAPGKFADMVVLNADPLENIRNVQNIDSVIKGGVSFLTAEILTQSPDEVIQRKVNAYNAHDEQALLDVYAGTAEISGFLEPDEKTDREKVLQEFKHALNQSPGLHVQILDRITMGDYVIDHQQISTARDSATIESIHLYHVKDSVIDREWKIR